MDARSAGLLARLPFAVPLGMALTAFTGLAQPAESLQADVCIVGGGSAGIGAAVAASRAGAKVILVERMPRLGGTSVNAYVCNWEPGPGGPIAREIYDRLSEMPNAVGITSAHNRDRKKGPFGLWLITPGLTYEETLRRGPLPPNKFRAVAFNPDAFCDVVTHMLRETGNCTILLRTTFIGVETDGRRVVSLKARSETGQVYTIRAKVFVDCSGGAHLCRACGCETMLGPDPKSRFNEPSAAEKPDRMLNAISLCYRIRKSDNPVRQKPPDPPVKGFPRSAHVHSCPGGDLIVNPLAMMPGTALPDMGYEKTYEACKRRVQAQWHWLQQHPTFSSYEFHSFAPMLGIRESYRVVTEYVLRQGDLLTGIEKQKHPDMIAIADHTMDVHGAGHKRISGKLKGPYGIPYRCLVPKGWENLLVAGRCAGLSQIAASSCRLSRTMMAMGRAAGVGAAIAARKDVKVMDVGTAELKKELKTPW